MLSSCTVAYAVMPSADTCAAPAGSHGAVTRHDVRQVADAVDQRLGDRQHVGRQHPSVVVDDHGDGVAGLGGEALVEQLDGRLRVGAR